MIFRLQQLFQPIVRRLLGTVTDFVVNEPMVALTFDDGPDARTTPQLLDLLERHQAKATFFVVGDSASQEPGLIKRMKSAGHAVANHTWSHRSMARTAGGERRRQVRSCAKAIAPCGRRLFRPPWGEQTVASRFDLLVLGYDVIGWSIDSGDWWDPDSDRMAAQLEARIKPGSVVLLHDAIRGDEGSPVVSPVLVPREAMLHALSRVLGRLGDRFRYVTIPEMFAHGRPVRRRWFHDPE